jgi:membrane protein YqaA with SNARE-associated domain
MSDQPPSDASAADAEAPAEPSLRRLLASAVLALGALLAVVALLGAWFRAPLVEWSSSFVEMAGGPGVALGFYVPDAFTIPIPSDAFSMVGLAGGLPFWQVVTWATAGSIAGGCTGWLIGRRLRRLRRLHRFASGRGAELERLIRRHGAWLIAFAAVSPLPYSLTAWVAGASRMPLAVFFVVSLLRVVRVAAPLYLIQLGLLTFSG